jgi:hypothetical protein
MNECTINLRKGDPIYQQWVNAITQKANFKPLQVFAADTANACATRTGLNSQQIITYNPYFFSQLSEIAIFAVLAHEVGHHYNRDIGHNTFTGKLNGFSDSHKRELRADYFAGWMTKLFVAQPLSTVINEYAMVGFSESYSHPSAENRIKAFQIGWSEASVKIVPPVQVTKKPNLIEDVAKVAGFALLVGIGVKLMKSA